VWKLWAKALGEKATTDNTEADRIAMIRTSLVVLNIITNLFIISGVVYTFFLK